MKEEKYYYVYINTNKYKANKLVYYEVFNDINDAISREKQSKAGPRKKKIELIKTINPRWRDLSENLYS